MIAAMLFAAISPETAVDAERAFAAMAQQDGQWTAFRAFATDDATMFVPQPVKAQEWLKDRRDPPRAVAWSPTASYVSCDGLMAVNTGEWRGADGGVGYFTTVWVKLADGRWRWVLDHGDTSTVARDRVVKPVVRRASCAGRPTENNTFAQYRWAGIGGGGPIASNPTLRYKWHAEPKHNREIEVAMWTGERWERVIHDSVPAPK